MSATQEVAKLYHVVYTWSIDVLWTKLMGVQ